MKKFNIIAVATCDGIIAVNGELPHEGIERTIDLKRFRKYTLNGIVIMGGKTFRSLPKPLPQRTNIIITTKSIREEITYEDGKITNIVYVNSFENALKAAFNDKNINTPVWVIGGESIYTYAIEHPQCGDIYINTVHIAKNLIADDTKDPPPINYFPQMSNLSCIREEAPFRVYRLPHTGEESYLELMRRLLSAPIESNRTGIPTRVLFAQTLRFKLGTSTERILPLLTTKKINYGLIVSELLWFIIGKCNTIDYLSAHDNHIWDANTTVEFLRSRGLDYPAGTCGPIYGCQWRDFGGVDQLNECINLLKTDPTSRRIIVSAWNPPELPMMALPPCHWSYQFCVVGGKLNILVNMRSADLALGVPFNIASYATLLHIVSEITSIEPGELTLVMANCHLYTNHIDGAQKQILRECKTPPTLEFPKLTSLDDVGKLEPSDFKVVNYSPAGFIKYPMAV